MATNVQTPNGPIVVRGTPPAGLTSQGATYYASTDGVVFFNTSAPRSKALWDFANAIYTANPADGSSGGPFSADGLTITKYKAGDDPPYFVHADNAQAWADSQQPGFSHTQLGRFFAQLGGVAQVGAGFVGGSQALIDQGNKQLGVATISLRNRGNVTAHGEGVVHTAVKQADDIVGPYIALHAAGVSMIPGVGKALAGLETTDPNAGNGNYSGGATAPGSPARSSKKWAAIGLGLLVLLGVLAMSGGEKAKAA